MSKSVGRLLTILGLAGVAIAQPVLDVMGGSPATFRFHRVNDGNLLLFGVAVVAIPPLILWLAGEVVFAMRLQWGRIGHLFLVGGLLALFASLLSKSVADNIVVNTIAALIGGVGGAFLYHRFAEVRSWLRLLSVPNVLFLGVFLLAAPVADSINEGTQTALDPPAELDDAPSVVMIVLDELPTQSLLNDELLIDPVRFPNLAQFAETSTWYRHFTTVSSFTQSAVPTLLDGRDPSGGPTWIDHPNSLFSLFGSSHHLVVSETITELCGLDVCGVRPVPPPPRAEATSEPTPEPTSQAVDIDTGPRWGDLIDATVDVWRGRVTPGRTEQVETFDDFVEEIVPVTTTTTDKPAPLVNPNDELDKDQEALERFLATQVFGQPDRFRLFVDAVRPTDEPLFAYLHLILPHQPWTLREDGTLYELPADRRDFASDNGDAWPAAVFRQRHLLQAEYADRLLGDVLARLVEIDEFDDSLIVVVSDHGVAFEPGRSGRRLSDKTLEQIVYSPLLIKAPGQTIATIDDSNINSTDVTPTIADLVGVDLPWETAGAPAGSATIEARGSAKYVHSFTDAFNYDFLGIVEFDDETSFSTMVDGRVGNIGPDDHRLAALYADIPGVDLIGESADGLFGAIGGTAEVASLGRLMAPRGAPLLGEIAGHLPPGNQDSTVLVAVNGQVIGVSPVFADANRFVVLLPGDALDVEINSIRIGRRMPDGTITEFLLAEAS